MAETEAPAARGPESAGDYDVIVIGAGVGGLVSAALLAKEGLNVLVVERQPAPGGLATSFERKGFLFQVPHLMGGCGRNGQVRRVLEHLGLLVDFERVEPFHRYIYPEHDITVGSDFDAFKEALKDDFLPQTANINRFFDVLADLNKAMDVGMLQRPMPVGNMLRALTYPVARPRFLAMRFGKLTYQKLMERTFTDKHLQAVLSSPWPCLGSPPWELSALSMIAMMNSYLEGAYMPVGGYRTLSDALAGSVEANGGTLLYRHEVNAVTTQDGRVTGVEMTPRAIARAGTVISDADTWRTFLRLLGRDRLSGALVEKVERLKPSMSGLEIHIGMSKTIDDPDLACGMIFVHPTYSHRAMYDELAATDRYPDPGSITWALVVPPLYDPSLAPPGKSYVDILVPAVPYGFMERWGVESGGKRGRKYRSLKERYAELVVEAVGGVFPGLISRVEGFDVSTPVTFERYTMALDGCWYDCAAIPGQDLGRRLGPKTPVRGLYLTGSKSALGGGMFAAVTAGLLAANLVTRGRLGDLF